MSDLAAFGSSFGHRGLHKSALDIFLMESTISYTQKFPHDLFSLF